MWLYKKNPEILLAVITKTTQLYKHVLLFLVTDGIWERDNPQFTYCAAAGTGRLGFGELRCEYWRDSRCYVCYDTSGGKLTEVVHIYIHAYFSYHVEDIFKYMQACPLSHLTLSDHVSGYGVLLSEKCLFPLVMLCLVQYAVIWKAQMSAKYSIPLPYALRWQILDAYEM